jgi:hypothetical protein
MREASLVLLAHELSASAMVREPNTNATAAMALGDPRFNAARS